MDAVARFTMFAGDLELVDDSVEKYNAYHGANGQFTSGGGSNGAFGGAKALHQNLAFQLDGVNNKIDALPKDPQIANDIAQTKVHLNSALKAPTPQGSAQALGNAYSSLDRAAQAVVGHKTPLAYQIKDIRQSVKFLQEGLGRP